MSDSRPQARGLRSTQANIFRLGRTVSCPRAPARKAEVEAALKQCWSDGPPEGGPWTRQTFKAAVELLAQKNARFGAQSHGGSRVSSEKRDTGLADAKHEAEPRLENSMSEATDPALELLLADPNKRLLACTDPSFSFPGAEPHSVMTAVKAVETEHIQELLSAAHRALLQITFPNRYEVLRGWRWERESELACLMQTYEARSHRSPNKIRDGVAAAWEKAPELEEVRHRIAALDAEERELRFL